MNIPKKVKDYLDKNKYKYEIIEHRTTFTAWDTAQTEKVKPQEVVKSLVMKADNVYLLALVSANRKLDKQQLLKTMNTARKKNGEKPCKKIDFAKEAWMKKNLPGKVGATSPFGKILGIPVYLDNLLAKNKKIYLGSGEYTVSIRVNTSRYLKAENPIRGSFSAKK